MFQQESYRCFAHIRASEVSSSSRNKEMVYHELLLALAGCPGDLFVETDGGEIEVRVFALYKDVCVCV